MRIASYARLDEMKDNRLRIVDAFLKADPKPNAVLSVGKTLLQHAAQWSHSELVQLLLDSGADPNRSGHSPSDALRLAIRNGDPASVDVLLKAGAESGYKIRGWTPLDLARELERRSEARNKKARDVTDAALAKTRAFGECATLLENPPLIVRAKPDQLQRQRQLRHKRYREEEGQQAAVKTAAQIDPMNRGLERRPRGRTPSPSSSRSRGA
jgi:hypothetical protein